jgi:ATP-dependent RNA helicase HelY
MQSRGFDARPLFVKPASAVFNWAAGKSWEEAVQAGQMAEGDLAMLVLRTADNLRHVAALKDVFPQIAATAWIAIEKILRDPVITELPEVVTAITDGIPDEHAPMPE